jgi:hypothetical protein
MEAANVSMIAKTSVPSARISQRRFVVTELRRRGSKNDVSFVTQIEIETCFTLPHAPIEKSKKTGRLNRFRRPIAKKIAKNHFVGGLP